MINFSVKGYKAFNKTKEFELAPINLLIGKNGSGKSNLINSILLFREAFSTRQKGDDLAEKLERLFYSLYEDRIRLGEHCLNSIIKNPFSADGLFTESALNKNSNDNTFELTFPLPLSYFKDSFRINLKYEVNLGDGELKGTTKLNEINVTSIDDKVILFSISKVNDKSQLSNIKINTDYVVKFLNNLEVEFKDLDNRDDGSWSEQWKHAEGYDWYIKEIGPEGLIKRLSTPFATPDLTTHLGIKSFGPQINKDQRESLIALYRRHQKIKAQDKKESSTTNSIESSDNVKLFIKMLNGQGRGVHENTADVFNNLTGNGPNFIDYFYLPIATTDPDGFNTTVRNFKPNHELELILYELLFRNISNSVSVVCNYLNEYSYIPPSRNNFYRSSNQISNTEITNKIRNQLFDIINKDKWRKPYLNFFNDWIKELDLPSDYRLDNLRKLIDILNVKNNLLSDSGYGINQLIPLLASISFFNEKFDYTSLDRLTEGYGEPGKDTMSYTKDASTLFLIEEPEANLHPNYQSKLADIFIDAAWKFGHNFIIETHSEYMVRKFQYWVAKGKIKPSDVNIYYFDNRNDDERVNDVIIKKININSDGSLSSSFGSGFYDETDNIALGIFNLNSKNFN